MDTATTAIIHAIGVPVRTAHRHNQFRRDSDSRSNVRNQTEALPHANYDYRYQENINDYKGQSQQGRDSQNRNSYERQYPQQSLRGKPQVRMQNQGSPDKLSAAKSAEVVSAISHTQPMAGRERYQSSVPFPSTDTNTISTPDRFVASPRLYSQAVRNVRDWGFEAGLSGDRPYPMPTRENGHASNQMRYDQAPLHRQFEANQVLWTESEWSSRGGDTLASNRPTKRKYMEEPTDPGSAKLARVEGKDYSEPARNSNSRGVTVTGFSRTLDILSHQVLTNESRTDRFGMLAWLNMQWLLRSKAPMLKNLGKLILSLVNVKKTRVTSQGRSDLGWSIYDLAHQPKKAVKSAPTTATKANPALPAKVGNGGSKGNAAGTGNATLVGNAINVGNAVNVGNSVNAGTAANGQRPLIRTAKKLLKQQHLLQQMQNGELSQQQIAQQKEQKKKEEQQKQQQQQKPRQEEAQKHKVAKLLKFEAHLTSRGNAYRQLTNSFRDALLVLSRVFDITLDDQSSFENGTSDPSNLTSNPPGNEDISDRQAQSDAINSTNPLQIYSTMELDHQVSTPMGQHGKQPGTSSSLTDNENLWQIPEGKQKKGKL
ncbi:hypothetical protein M427DRAFT_130053 [Gonapodya prolifera JEL478]|uniref:Uncharacterized protein n=1 Tax=Gonapodya prolifera (strain JEL478) TaxID=1344416 RepID=A0A139B026_GONPJ|nr:hypothetical protein M427DRAFT_130053 [Gonapodya prolifera JEL478]|eukprot:KXS22348.1 hypothetical protein M427DRAFT_130053 [Gonapodya prolifera JEL478]